MAFEGGSMSSSASVRQCTPRRPVGLVDVVRLAKCSITIEGYLKKGD